MVDSASTRRHRRWPIFAPLVFVVVLAAGWTGFWFYAASRAETAISVWREREAKAGRVQTCGHQSMGGYPFRLELRCDDFRQRNTQGPALNLALPSAFAAIQVYGPDLAISEFTGPLTLSTDNDAAKATFNWRLGEASLRTGSFDPSLIVRGLQVITGQVVDPVLVPIERASLVFDAPTFDYSQSGSDPVAARADHLELHVRPLPGTSNDQALEIGIRLNGAVAPDIHPVLDQPVDATIDSKVSGLTDIQSKPWPLRLREWQAHGGQLTIIRARIQQGDVVAVGAGTLSLTARGTLEGQLQMTVAGIEEVLKKLNLEQLLSQGQVGQTIDSLDQIMPGLSDFARQNATPSILAGLGMLGERTTLDGKPAISLPLRFVDGRVMLGPFGVGRVPPVF